MRTYHQIPADIPKTATPFGLFKFVCMPFGLHDIDAAQNFQHFIDHVHFCFTYMNDVQFAGASAENTKNTSKQFSLISMTMVPFQTHTNVPEFRFLKHHMLLLTRERI